MWKAHVDMEYLEKDVPMSIHARAKDGWNMEIKHRLDVL